MRKYLENLVALCTEAQKERFRLMYPEGVSGKQLNHAIWQVENTLRDLDSQVEKLKREKKEQEEALKEAEKSLKVAEQEAKASDRKLRAALEERPSYDDDEVQKRLRILDALEAAGVDNWEWYDDAVADLP